MIALGSQMAAEIAGSAAPVRSLLTDPSIASRVAVFRRCRGVALVARGSSDHAAAYGRYLLEQALAVPAWSIAPSQTTRYDVELEVRDLALIAVSQSGETPEIVSVAEAWLERGAMVTAITNEANSALARLVEQPILLNAGVERAVPSTKTFTATLAAFLRLATTLNPTRLPVDADAVSTAVENAIDDHAAVAEMAAVIDRSPIVVHVGRGFLLPIAREAALKCIESARAPTFAWSPVDFRHGPFALAGPELCAVIHHAEGSVGNDTKSLAGDLAATGATVVSVGSPVGGETAHVSVPAGLAEWERPLVHAVRTQQLALELARRRGLDPDHPHGLNKVTFTT